MQCWNCGFENIPGMNACARCASTLNLDGVDVEPPRSSASHWATKRARLSNRVKSVVPLYAHAVNWVTRPFPVLHGVFTNARLWRTAMLSLIPGLAHIKTRRPRSGYIFLCTWLGLLLLALLSIGTDWTWWLLNAVILTHAVSVAALLAEQMAFERPVIRALFGICLFATLYFAIYQPATWLLGRYYQPIVMPRQGSTILSAGDGILCQGPWTRPRQFARGDLVIYDVRAYQISALIVRGGFGLDRIVGVPGDHVQVQDGRLLVNGKEPEGRERPLGPVPHWLADIDLQVREGRYAIIPSNFDWTQHGNVDALRGGEEFALHLTDVAYDDITGCAVLRIRPLSRFGRIE